MAGPPILRNSLILLIFFLAENILRMGILIPTIGLTSEYLRNTPDYWATCSRKYSEDSRLYCTEFNSYALLEKNVYEDINSNDLLEFEIEEICNKERCVIFEEGGTCLGIDGGSYKTCVVFGMLIGIAFTLYAVISDVVTTLSICCNPNATNKTGYKPFFTKYHLSRCILADSIDTMCLVFSIPVYLFEYDTKCVKSLDDPLYPPTFDEPRGSPCEFIYIIMLVMGTLMSMPLLIKLCMTCAICCKDHKEGSGTGTGSHTPNTQNTQNRQGGLSNTEMVGGVKLKEGTHPGNEGEMVCLCGLVGFLDIILNLTLSILAVRESLKGEGEYKLIGVFAILRAFLYIVIKYLTISTIPKMQANTVRMNRLEEGSNTEGAVSILSVEDSPNPPQIFPHPGDIASTNTVTYIRPNDAAYISFSPPVITNHNILNPHIYINRDSNNMGETPPDLICPIFHKIMMDPVVAADGHIYLI